MPLKTRLGGWVGSNTGQRLRAEAGTGPKRLRSISRELCTYDGWKRSPRVSVWNVTRPAIIPTHEYTSCPSLRHRDKSGRISFSPDLTKEAGRLRKKASLRAKKKSRSSIAAFSGLTVGLQSKGAKAKGTLAFAKVIRCTSYNRSSDKSRSGSFKPSLNQPQKASHSARALFRNQRRIAPGIRASCLRAIIKKRTAGL